MRLAKYKKIKSWQKFGFLPDFLKLLTLFSENFGLDKLLLKRKISETLKYISMQVNNYARK